MVSDADQRERHITGDRQRRRGSSPWVRAGVGLFRSLVVPVRDTGIPLIADADHSVDRTEQGSHREVGRQSGPIHEGLGGDQQRSGVAPAPLTEGMPVRAVPTAGRRRGIGWDAELARLLPGGIVEREQNPRLERVWIVPPRAPACPLVPSHS